jgi:histidinol phosphatase-like PHP family hydrolase
MIVDLHAHSTFSDGALTPRQLFEAAQRRGYNLLALTDHGTAETYREVAGRVRDEVDRLRSLVSMQVLAGIELTDLEPSDISDAAREARREGAQIVVVHGECVTMDTRPGTNAAAARSEWVDVLAHPGLISCADAQACLESDVCLELSARRGHSYGNGWVFRTAMAAGAQLVVNSDSHDEAGLLSAAKVEAIVRGAGASEAEARSIEASTQAVVVRRVNQRMVPA